jgi:DNA-binding protein YbaB
VKNMASMMKQAQKMQADMARVQEELADAIASRPPSEAEQSRS